jgi:adenylate cyclase
MKWEVDFFKGSNNGLIMAEIELAYAEQDFMKPPWVGREVTFDQNYYNMNLYKNPYKLWDATHTSELEHVHLEKH